MSDLPDALRRSHESFDAARRMTTGAGAPDVGHVAVSFDSSFREFSSAAYQWFYELLAHDRIFLMTKASASQRADLNDLERLVKDQRHLNEHATYERADRAQAWRDEVHKSAGEKSDAVLNHALASELLKGLLVLEQLARHEAARPPGESGWSAHSASTPEGEIQAVLDDLGMTVAPQRHSYLVRQFTGMPSLRQAKTSEARRQLAASMIVGRDFGRLSIPYVELLDSFSLVGSRDSRALLVLAHSVELCGHRGAKTRAVLSQVWPLVRP